MPRFSLFFFCLILSSHFISCAAQAPGDAEGPTPVLELLPEMMEGRQARSAYFFTGTFPQGMGQSFVVYDHEKSSQCSETLREEGRFSLSLYHSGDLIGQGPQTIPILDRTSASNAAGAPFAIASFAPAMDKLPPILDEVDFPTRNIFAIGGEVEVDIIQDPRQEDLHIGRANVQVLFLRDWSLQLECEGEGSADGEVHEERCRCIRSTGEEEICENPPGGNCCLASSDDAETLEFTFEIEVGEICPDDCSATTSVSLSQCALVHPGYWD